MGRSSTVTDTVRTPRYAWVVLITGIIAVFGALGLARFGYSTLLPEMQIGLALDNAHAGLLATANLLGYLAMSAIGGALAVRYGARIVAAIGLALAGAGMLLTGSAGSFYAAALWRAATGLGSGAANVSVMGLLPTWFPPAKRGFASGIAVSGSSVALILTGLFVPRILADGDGDAWRSCWLLFGFLTLGAAAAAFALLRNSPAVPPKNPGESEPARPASSWRLIYRSSAVWRLGAVYTVFGFSYIIYLTFFVKYLMAEAGYTREAANTLFMVMGLFSLFCGLLWGHVSDLIGRGRAMALVFLAHASAYSLFALCQSPPGLLLSAILFGLSAWSIPAIMAAACGDCLGSMMAPAALGFITLFFGVGQALGPGLAGLIADTAGTFRPVFLLAAGAALIGAAGSWTVSINADSPMTEHFQSTRRP